MWNAERSVKLSRFLTRLFLVLLVLVCIALPWITRWYITTAGRPESLMRIIPAACYPCVPFALAALIALDRLLGNILRSDIFVPQNVFLLRMLSWCCTAAALITLAAGFFYMPFFLIAAAAGFMALILRVIKNVFCAAIELKTENDMTI